MVTDNKFQAVINFLITCPTVQANPLYFNFLQAQDENKQVVMQANDKVLNRTFIDGSVKKQFIFTLNDFRSVSYQQIPKVQSYSSENIEELTEVQELLDWINTQAELRVYPDFGEDCIIDNMSTTSENPNLAGVDTSVSPALAKYSMSIKIDYIDTSKRIWGNN